MKASLTEGAVIHADETVVQVHKEEGKANTSESGCGSIPAGCMNVGKSVTSSTSRIAAENTPLRLLGAYAAEVAGGHAERRDKLYLKSGHRL